MSFDESRLARTLFHIESIETKETLNINKCISARDTSRKGESMENLKIKLSVLWIFWILGFLIHMFLAVFEEAY